MKCIKIAGENLYVDESIADKFKEEVDKTEEIMKKLGFQIKSGRPIDYLNTVYQKFYLNGEHKYTLRYECDQKKIYKTGLSIMRFLKTELGVDILDKYKTTSLSSDNKGCDLFTPILMLQKERIRILTNTHERF